MGKRRYKWTQEDIRLLEEYYPQEGGSCSRRLGSPFSKKTIMKKARYLGIKRDLSLYPKRISQETRKKMSAVRIGRSCPEDMKRWGDENPFYGKHHSLETRQKLSAARIGKTLSEETKQKVSIAGKGRHHSSETRRKMSETRRGDRNPMYGKHPSAETRRKMSEALKGSKHPQWRGGVSKSYNEGWTNSLKESIRQRDNYRCRMCGIPQKDKKLAIHHIDYDKENLDPKNLVALCNTCHSKTTNSKREYWTPFFKALVIEIGFEA